MTHSATPAIMLTLSICLLAVTSVHASDRDAPPASSLRVKRAEQAGGLFRRRAGFERRHEESDSEGLLAVPEADTFLCDASAVPYDVSAEMARIRVATDKIIEFGMLDGQGQAYKKLDAFVGATGSRFAGSPGLEKAVDYMEQAMREDGMENVHIEQVVVPSWIRGNESARIVRPGSPDIELDILAFGGSPGTPAGGITVPVTVVRDVGEFEVAQAQGRVAGRAIVWNYFCDWVAKPNACYGESVGLRSQGAQLAEGAGGVASLVRPMGPREGPDIPHTGGGGNPSIPNICVSHSAVDRMQFLQDQGLPFQVHIESDAHFEEDKVSYNVVGEWIGATKPNETVIFGGHLDSWDVGVGAMDDGGGMVISWQALSYLRQLGLRPARTIRVVMWTNEEFPNPISGADQYFDAHRDEVPQVSLVMESDSGTFDARGIDFTGSDPARCLMRNIGQLLDSIDTTVVGPQGGGADIAPWMQAGVPGASLNNANADYFYYHHTRQDQMAVQEPYFMDTCSITWAVTAYAVADLPGLLPRMPPAAESV